MLQWLGAVQRGPGAIAPCLKGQQHCRLGVQAPPHRTLLVMRFSAASTTPSLARMPTQEPALEMASMAYLGQRSTRREL